jgi:hypothetical protein
MTLITDSNWDVNYFISPDSDLRLGNCDYNGTRVIYAASVPFIYVNYSSGMAFTDHLESSSGTADVRTISDGFDIRATYDLYGGTYLYEHIWRFYSDGQFGSTIIVLGPGVDHNDNHIYHVPFRYDLDISGASGDSFQRRFLPFPFAPWADVAQEGRVLPGLFPPTLFNWRLVDNTTGRRAMIRAREGDNGEIWAFQYSSLEAWTSWGGVQSAPPGSPGSVPAVYDNNQSVQNTDVVLWYIAHIPSANLITGCGPSLKLLGF